MSSPNEGATGAVGSSHCENWPQPSETLKLHPARMITGVTSTAPRERRNGNIRVGYLGRAALRRQHYDIFAESQGMLLGSGTTNSSPWQCCSGGIPGSNVVYTVQRRQTVMPQWNMSHYVAQINNNCKKKCFLWGPPRGCIRRADWSVEWVRRQWVCRQAVWDRRSWALTRRPWADQYSLELAVSECSSQAARMRGIALVRSLKPGNDYRRL
jgi:hypothetical protein